MPDTIVTGPGDLARIVQAYRDAELHILTLLRDAVGTGSEGHYRRQQQELSRLLRGAERALGRAVALTNAEVEGLLAANYQHAATVAVPGVMPPVVPEEAVQALALETAGAVASLRENVLRDVSDTYRRVVRTVATRAVISGETRTQRLQQALDLFAKRGITGFTDMAGRRWGIDTYAEMSVRTAVNRAQNEGRRRQYADYGIDLIVTSSHRGCSDLCLPYQGRILAMTGPAGERVVEDQVRGGTTTVTVTATWEQAVAGGYSHVNCRHTNTAYIGGTPLPEPVDTDEDDYAAEQHQRYLERGIRSWKKQEAVAMTPERERYARGKVREWQARQRTHLREHEWLTRRYDREQVRVARGGTRDVPAQPTVVVSPFGTGTGVV